MVYNQQEWLYDHNLYIFGLITNNNHEALYFIESGSNKSIASEFIVGQI